MARVSQMFREASQDSWSPGGFGRTDIYEQDRRLHYEIELPGVSRDDISVQVENGALVVRGEIRRSRTAEQAEYLRMERRYGTLHKQFPLPGEIGTPEDIEARFENGILHLSLPLQQSPRANVIDVEIQ